MKIQSTKTSDATKIKMLIYGKAGAGKTTLAKTLPGKTLIVSAESGLLSLQDFDIDYVTVEGTSPADKLASLRAITIELMSGVAYDNIFIDSITEISQVVLEEGFTKYPSMKDSMLRNSDYFKYMMTFLKFYRDMPRYNIIMSCLEKDSKDDLQRKECLPDLQGQIATKVLALFDEVFNLKVVRTEEEDKRVLITDHYDCFTCKDRSGHLSKFEQADLGIVFNKIKGVKNV